MKSFKIEIESTADRGKITVDGNPIKGVVAFKVTQAAGEFAKVTLIMNAEQLKTSFDSAFLINETYEELERKNKKILAMLDENKLESYL